MPQTSRHNIMLPKDIQGRTPWTSWLEQLYQIFSHGCRVNSHSLRDLPSVSAEYKPHESSKDQKMIFPKILRKKSHLWIWQSRFLQASHLYNIATHQLQCQLYDHHLQLQQWNNPGSIPHNTPSEHSTLSIIQNWPNISQKKYRSKFSSAVFLRFNGFRMF